MKYKYRLLFMLEGRKFGFFRRLVRRGEGGGGNVGISFADKSRPGARASRDIQLLM